MALLLSRLVALLPLRPRRVVLERRAVLGLGLVAARRFPEEAPPLPRPFVVVVVVLLLRDARERDRFGA